MSAARAIGSSACDGCRDSTRRGQISQADPPALSLAMGGGAPRREMAFSTGISDRETDALLFCCVASSGNRAQQVEVHCSPSAGHPRLA